MPKRGQIGPLSMSGPAALCRRHFPKQLHTRTCLPLLPPTSAGSPAVRPRVWVSPTSSRTPAEAWQPRRVLSTPEASATTRSTRAGTPPPRTPHHYPDSPQSSANVTALPAVVARPDPPPDDHSSRTSFRHALITHCLLPAGCYGQDPRAAATTTPSARRSLTLTATTSAAARRRLQRRLRERRRRLLTGPVRHRQRDR